MMLNFILTAIDIDPYTEMEAWPDGNDLLASLMTYVLSFSFIHV